MIPSHRGTRSRSPTRGVIGYDPGHVVAACCRSRSTPTNSESRTLPLLPSPAPSPSFLHLAVSLLISPPSLCSCVPVLCSSVSIVSLSVSVVSIVSVFPSFPSSPSFRCLGLRLSVVSISVSVVSISPFPSSSLSLRSSFPFLHLRPLRPLRPLRLSVSILRRRSLTAVPPTPSASSHRLMTPGMFAFFFFSVKPLSLIVLQFGILSKASLDTSFWSGGPSMFRRIEFPTSASTCVALVWDCVG